MFPGSRGIGGRLKKTEQIHGWDESKKNVPHLESWGNHMVFGEHFTCGCVQIGVVGGGGTGSTALGLQDAQEESRWAGAVLRLQWVTATGAIRHSTGELHDCSEQVRLYRRVRRLPVQCPLGTRTSLGHVL